jgi:hypothetical protein
MEERCIGLMKRLDDVEMDTAKRTDALHAVILRQGEMRADIRVIRERLALPNDRQGTVVPSGPPVIARDQRP